MAILSTRSAVPYNVTLIPAGTVINTAGTITGGAAGAGLAWIVKGLAPYDYFEAILDTTAAATDVGDLLDVYLDTSFNGGATWINCVHFTQQLGNGGAKREGVVVSPFSQTATAPVNLASDAASGAVRHLFGDQVRVRVVTVDAGTQNISFTTGLYFQPS